MTVKAMIAFAYNVREFYISGGPGWAGSDNFDILAKAEAGTTREQGGGFIRFDGRGAISAQGAAMTGLSQHLSTELERIVIDKTGLTANYDFKLAWMPDESLPEKLKLADTAPPDSNRPSLFTALQEQLGLKLVAAKAPVETVVIERVEKPSEN